MYRKRTILNHELARDLAYHNTHCIMETFANMKCNFLKTSWGVVEINNVKVYCELWLSTASMNLKAKFKITKGMSYSYTCSAKDAPFEDGLFLSYWIPKNVYFPVHFCGSTCNELISLVVKHLNLKFFEESRKWLTDEEKEVAHMVATESIGILDAEELLATDVADMPQAFHKEVSRFRDEYNAYLNRLEQEDREMASKLKTPEGLAYMLRIARMHGEHRPAVSFIKELIFDLTELWDK